MASGVGKVPDEASIRRFSAGATVVLLAAVAGVAWTIERANQRWEEEHNPVARIRAKLERRRIVNRERRGMVMDMLRVMSQAPARARRTPPGPSSA